jgi:hypothetical protein
MSKSLMTGTNLACWRVPRRTKVAGTQWTKRRLVGKNVREGGRGQSRRVWWAMMKSFGFILSVREVFIFLSIFIEVYYTCHKTTNLRCTIQLFLYFKEGKHHYNHLENIPILPISFPMPTCSYSFSQATANLYFASINLSFLEIFTYESYNGGLGYLASFHLAGF